MKKKLVKWLRKWRKNNFTLDDFLKQMNQVRKLGPLQNIIGMLPGMGQIKDQLKDLDLNSKEVRRIEAIITSMTAAERENPNILMVLAASVLQWGLVRKYKTLIAC